ncbi:MAG: hypothetical protein ACXW6J_19930 [Candidatus Binatia bacterium]
MAGFEVTLRGERDNIREAKPDRSKERLGSSDLAIITARRRLLNLARELQQGIEPFPASHGDIYRVRAMDVNVSLDDFEAMIVSHGSGLLAKV